MDIYLTETDGSRRFTFPILPERIRVKNSTNYQSYDLLALGKAKYPNQMSPTTISWDGVFFGAAKRKESIVRHWQKPSECEKILQTWQANGTVLRLMVTETNINLDVTISSFTVEEAGGYGNQDYSIEFVRYQYLRIYTTDELNITGFASKVNLRPATVKTMEGGGHGNYTVVSGDNLWKIARKFYRGSGSDWKKIYDANVSVIEETAKKYGKANSNNGWWIYPGTVLSIP